MIEVSIPAIYWSRITNNHWTKFHRYCRSILTCKTDMVTTIIRPQMSRRLGVSPSSWRVMILSKHRVGELSPRKRAKINQQQQSQTPKWAISVFCIFCLNRTSFFLSFLEIRHIKSESNLRIGSEALRKRQRPRCAHSEALCSQSEMPTQHETFGDQRMASMKVLTLDQRFWSLRQIFRLKIYWFGLDSDLGSILKFLFKMMF